MWGFQPDVPQYGTDQGQAFTKQELKLFYHITSV